MDTRLNKRVSVSAPVLIRITESSQKDFSLKSGNDIKSKLVNISIGGLSFITPYYIPKKVGVESEINAECLGGVGKILIEGLIAYCRQEKHTDGYRCGMKFIQISNDIIVLITTYIKAHSLKDS